MTLSERVRDMTQKMLSTAELIQRLRDENSALQQSNRELNARLEHAAAALEQAHTLKTEGAGKEANGGDPPTPELTDKLREEIEHYIAEIDKCIDWLRNN